MTVNSSIRGKSILGFGALVAMLVATSSATAQMTCSGQPAPAHVNGLGQSFNSCAPLATPGVASSYNLQLATAARSAWPYQGTDMTATCANRAQAVFRQTATTCAVWQFTGPNAGHVHLSTTNNNCLCADATDPVWR